MTSPEPYLIAHLVRGQPTFDIATRFCEGDAPCQPACGLYPRCKEEEWWIIPTSGHRAYPYWSWNLEHTELSGGTETLLEIAAKVTIPEGLRDHYSITDRTHFQASDEDAALSRETAKPGQGLITNLAERLGFIPKPLTIPRR